MGRPRLVLADEPTGQQDQATGARVLDLVLSRVRSIGAALVVATHDLAVAARLPTRWRMRDGEPVGEGARGKAEAIAVGHHEEVLVLNEQPVPPRLGRRAAVLGGHEIGAQHFAVEGEVDG